tara:strand:- start:773 stop:988 length:216 start_codon:yes stop_codon:yes gene_type:complete
MKAKFSNPKMMSTKDLEKEIVKAIKEESKIPLVSDVGYKDLIKLVKHLFNEYRGERLYTTGTVIGLLKGDK